jgi:hypothetical protein
MCFDLATKIALGENKGLAVLGRDITANVALE